MGALNRLVDPGAPSHTDPEMELPTRVPSRVPTAAEMTGLIQQPVPEELRQVDVQDARGAEAPNAASIVALASAEVAHMASPADVELVTPSLVPVAPAPTMAALPASTTAGLETQHLLQLLSGMRWADAGSADSEVRSQALAQRFFVRRLVLAGCAKGQHDAMADVWLRFAPQGAPDFEDLLERQRATIDLWPRAVGPAPVFHATVASSSATALAPVAPVAFEPKPAPEFPARPAPARSTPVVNKAVPSRPERAGGAGGGGGDLGLGSLVRAPFLLAGAAGSLVLAGLQQVGSAALGAYDRSRVNGHGILASQLDGSAQRVVSLADQLKRQGMGDVIDAIRHTGAPPEEVFKGMEVGGKYDALGKKYDRLLRRPEVAATFADLQGELDRFGHLSKRYAKTGAALNLDVELPIRRGSDAMMGALEGMPIKDAGGTFKHLQDRLHELTRQIVEMVQRLFSRLSPA